MITQEQIQSIVDGECSHEIRASLLRQMDSEPSTWRTLALSLLEEQEWCRQVSEMAKCPLMVNQCNEPNRDDDTTSRNSHVDAFSSQSQVRLAAHLDDQRVARRRTWQAVLAASLLVGAGFYGGSYLPRFGGLDSNGTNGEALAIKESSEPANSAESDTNMRMLVSAPNRETSEIPIYELNAEDHEVFAAKEAYEVARLNQRLRKEGFELDVRPEYYTGKLHDGRKLIVPVKQIGLKPFGL